MSNETKSAIGNRQSAKATRILYLFTRTPLHVGAGASVGAIDQPIIRERHTGFPVIPATTLKGVFADEWNEPGKKKRKKDDGSEEEIDVIQRSADGKWLFGETEAENAAAGALQFSEAKFLAFPIRSAKGSFAWITCPLMLRRAVRDGALRNPDGSPLQLADTAFTHLDGNAGDANVLLAANGPLALRPPQGQQGDTKVVLEEYTFTHRTDLPPGVGDALQRLLPDDEVWKEVASRLVILSDGMMSFFAENACEVAQHVKISDETGTAAGGALFNQQNVPSETLFYSVLHAFRGRGEKFKQRTPDQALKAFQGQDDQGKDQPDKPGVRCGSVFQFGGDASTGLGYCTVKLDGEKKEVAK